MRVFVNAAAWTCHPGTSVRGAIRAHDPALGAQAEAGDAP